MSARNLFYARNHKFLDCEDKDFARDELIYNVTADLLVIMEDENVSKTELAERMNKAKSFITRILNGNQNMTLGTLSDICHALKIKPEIRLPVKKVSDTHSYSAYLSADVINSTIQYKTRPVHQRHEDLSRRVSADRTVTPSIALKSYGRAFKNYGRSGKTMAAQLKTMSE